MKLMTITFLALGLSFAQTDLPINYYQVKGTHNSYHKKPLIRVTKEYNYTHETLTNQLGLFGIRQLELDLNVSWRNKLKVNHVPLIDPRSTCKKFKDCITEIRDWSLLNPDHFPIMVWIEPKKNPMPRIHPLYKRFNIKHLLKAQDQIQEVFQQDHLFTPNDLVKGDISIRESLIQYGWPTLSQMRGKVIFILLNYEKIKEDYLKQTSLENRVLFVRTKDLKDPEGAFVKEGSCYDIQKYLDAQFIYTGKSEGVTYPFEEAKQNIKACIKNGVHVLSGDRPTTKEFKNIYFSDEYIINKNMIKF